MQQVPLLSSRRGRGTDERAGRAGQGASRSSVAGSGHTPSSRVRPPSLRPPPRRNVYLFSFPT